MSPRQTLAGLTGAVFVSVLLILTTPVSGADYTATATGSVNITFSVPSTPEPDPDPKPQPEQPFDWNWKYDAPTCDGVTIAFPSNLPASQQGVMEVNVVGGSVSGMQYKLEGQDYQAKYPNGHAGQTVFVPWLDFRNYAIPAAGTWTVTQLQVHGTNYHWQGNLVCGSAPALEALPASPRPPMSEPELVPVPVPEPEATPTPEPDPVPAPEPEAIPVPEPTPEISPEPEPVPEPISTPATPPAPTPVPSAPVPEPESRLEEVVALPAESPDTSAEEPEDVPAEQPDDQEGTIQE